MTSLLNYMIALYWQVSHAPTLGYQENKSVFKITCLQHFFGFGWIWYDLLLYGFRFPPRNFFLRAKLWQLNQRSSFELKRRNRYRVVIFIFISVVQLFFSLKLGYLRLFSVHSNQSVLKPPQGKGLRSGWSLGWP